MKLQMFSLIKKLYQIFSTSVGREPRHVEALLLGPVLHHTRQFLKNSVRFLSCRQHFTRIGKDSLHWSILQTADLLIDGFIILTKN